MIAQWNRRFTLYAKWNGRSEEGQLARDAEVYPSGKMTGFILWCSQRRQEYKAAGHAVDREGLPLNPAAFSAWLESRVAVMS